MTETFKVWNDNGRGYATRIEVNGHEVTEAFSRLEIRAGVTGPVEIELNAAVDEVPATEDRPARLFIFGPTRELLLKWGWTPPPGDSA